MFAEGMLSTSLALNFPIWAIITGLGITLLVIAGIRWIARLPPVFVPLFIAAVVISPLCCRTTVSSNSLTRRIPVPS